MRKWKVSVGDPPTRPSIGCLDHAHCNEREHTRKLTSEGWAVRRAPDNLAALSLAAANPFDLIMTGTKTRGSEGLELLHEIRSVRPLIRLIILTNEWTPGDVVAAMCEHAFSYFSGPFEHAALIEMVPGAIASPCWDNGIEVVSATPAWVQSMNSSTKRAMTCCS
jgi:DNA-binding NtrC family response regulator